MASFYVANGLGDSIHSPAPEQMRAFLEAIDVTDVEHGAAWLGRDDGPSLEWNGDGRLVLTTDRARPRHMLRVPRERALALWMALAAGHLDEVERCDWKPGNGGQSRQIHVPSSVGRAALDELDGVPWASLAHAYGTGRLGSELYQDVAATLRRLGDTDPCAHSDATYAFFSSLCHQGTIYEATPFAVPFLAAFAAGTDLASEQARALVAMLASVGVACSFDARTVRTRVRTAAAWRR